MRMWIRDAIAYLLHVSEAKPWFRTTLVRVRDLVLLLPFTERFVKRPASSKSVTLNNGLQFEQLDLRDFLQRTLFFAKAYSEDELSILDRFLKPGDTFVDVGANIGLFSAYAARIIGATGQIIAIEPAEDTVRKLRANLTLNGVKSSVTLLELGLADSDSILELRASDKSGYHVGGRSILGGGEVLQAIQVKPFDQLIANGDVAIKGPIGVVKIDVEGAEPYVLRGMRETISTYKPRAILIEMGHSDHDVLSDLRSEFDYELSPLGNQNNAVWIPQNSQSA